MNHEIITNNLTDQNISANKVVQPKIIHRPYEVDNNYVLIAAATAVMLAVGGLAMLAISREESSPNVPVTTASATVQH